MLRLTREGMKKLLKEENSLKDQIFTLQEQKKNTASCSGSRGDGRIELSGVEQEIESTYLRLVEVRKNISSAIIIEEEKDMGTLCIGRKAKILLSGEEMEIMITDPVMTDPSNGTVSYNSPLGRALLGSKPGDVRQYEVMDRDFVVEVLEINI